MIHEDISHINEERDDPILSVDHLTIGFTQAVGVQQDVVHDLSFNLYPGKIMGLVGESGSGKSVSSMSLAKLLPSPPLYIRSGKATFVDGQEILALAENEIRKYRGKDIAVVFQEPMTSLNPSMRCGKQVSEMLEIHSALSKEAIRSEVIRLFEQVELPDPERAYQSYPHELSGGQLQRVMIAMAISCKPRILIADEPTTALDVLVQQTILKLLKDLVIEYRIATIFITHDLGVIQQIADDVLVLYKGRLMDYGPVNDVFENPKSAYTKGLMACRPPLYKRYRRLPMVQDFLEMPGDEHEEYLKSLAEDHLSYSDRIAKIDEAELLLEVRNLKKYYPILKGFWGRKSGFVKAVDDVSFQLKKGQSLGLVGASGCGKSTLGRVIMCLDQPTDGDVIFNGKHLHQLTKRQLRRERRHFQMIFQDPYSSLNPRMTVGEAIAEPLQVHKVMDKRKQKDKVAELLEKVGLDADFAKRYPHQFSGGQRQRICIARALSIQPAFILCDESVSALDVSVQAQVLNLLKDLQEEYDLSYLFISHDIGVVKFMCDHVLVMDSGKIVERGDVEQVILHPKESYTNALIEAIP